MPALVVAAADSQTIVNVHRQLQQGFCPAVRTAAQTGANLLVTRSAYFKAFNTHLVGLQELAKSGMGVSEESNRYTNELAAIIETFLRINAEEEKLFLSFTNLIAAVTKFSESEKERLKELSARFQKDEKAIGKAAKRTGNTNELHEFYANEYKKIREQHAQRYAYFAKNYLELLRKHSECSKRNIEIAEKQLLESDAADAVKRLEDVVGSNDTIKSVPNEEHVLVREQDTTAELYERPLTPKEDQAPIVTGGIVTKTSVRSQKAEDKSRRSTVVDAGRAVASIQTTEELVQPDSRPNTAASSKSRLSSGSELNLHHSYGERGSPAAPPRKILSPHIYKPTPILGLVEAEMNAAEAEAPPKQLSRPTSNGDHWSSRPDQDFIEPIPRPDYIPANHIYEPPRQQPIPKPSFKPTYVPEQPPIAPRENRSPPPKYAKPSEQLPAPPIYSAHDYGRTMVCTQKYTATGDHQLSLEVGDQVKLVKSGNRGWLLVRTPDGRQGWFPCKFLSFV